MTAKYITRILIGSALAALAGGTGYIMTSEKVFLLRASAEIQCSCPQQIGPFHYCPPKCPP